MIEAKLIPVVDFAALGRTWRSFETRADGSFFQSWAWMGCLAEQRFDRPTLIEVRKDGEVAALALFNRHRRALFLGETGIPAWDSVFIEHNGLLIARDEDTDRLIPAGLHVARARRLVLGGVDEAHRLALRALPGSVRIQQTRPAPYVDYAALPAGPYAASLSANTRYQIRRSDRRYATGGELRIERAGTVAEGHEFLAALAALHQRYWQSRGRPGAFAGADFTRFHHALIDRAMPAREIDLLRVSAGHRVIGFLYNFVYRRHVYSYQSGFDYQPGEPHLKPGLTSHRLAIELYRSEGMRRYDFLGGEDRYKTSLANASTTLHWLEYLPRFSARWLAAGARQLLRRQDARLAATSGPTERCLGHRGG
jgi:CelD/BcsL family acetyltransferase involved in cellulose biosynthesis